MAAKQSERATFGTRLALSLIAAVLALLALVALTATARVGVGAKAV